jgi:cytochrome-b5 reductase
LLSATINGEQVNRPYTPTSSDDDKGFFELVFKVYQANVNPKFPNGGKMTQHLDTLKPGDSVLVKGPLGRLNYKGNGEILATIDYILLESCYFYS